MGWLVTDLILGLIGFVASVLIVLSIVGIGETLSPFENILIKNSMKHHSSRSQS